jgi:hypothetical protein
VASYAEMMQRCNEYAMRIAELERAVNEWRNRFRAIVGEDRPDAAGNAVIHLQRDAEQQRDRAVAAEQRCAALHRNTDRPSLRDTFAAAALTGLLARGMQDWITEGSDSIARVAYGQADAMLARRAVVKP